MKIKNSDWAFRGHLPTGDDNFINQPHYCFGGGGGAPAESKTDKEIKKLNLRELRKQANDKGDEMEANLAEMFKMPDPIAPPPQTTTADTEAASREQRRQILKRSSMRKSRLSSNSSSLGGGGSLGSK